MGCHEDLDVFNSQRSAKDSGHSQLRYQNFEFVEAGTEDPDLLGVSCHHLRPSMKSVVWQVKFRNHIMGNSRGIATIYLDGL